jgi:hypothetical protein
MTPLFEKDIQLYYPERCRERSLCISLQLTDLSPGWCLEGDLPSLAHRLHRLFDGE